ncbi:MAG: hypothetical protein AAF823_01300 [Planctomycetota bacterium]
MALFVNPWRPWRSVKALQTMDEPTARALWWRAARESLPQTIVAATLALCAWWFLVGLLAGLSFAYFDLGNALGAVVLALVPPTILIGWVATVFSGYHDRTAKRAKHLLSTYWDNAVQLRCVHCDYDLKGTPQTATACPECGMAINRRRKP